MWAEPPQCCEGQVGLPPPPKGVHTCAHLSASTSSSWCPEKPLAKCSPRHPEAETTRREKLNTQTLEIRTTVPCPLPAPVSRWLSRSHFPVGEHSHLSGFQSDSCLQVEPGSDATTSRVWARSARPAKDGPTFHARLQMPFKMSSPPPSPSLLRGKFLTLVKEQRVRKATQGCERSAASLGKSHQAVTFFLAPCHHPFLPAPTEKEGGTYPSPTTTHLMACMSLGPWQRTVPGAKESQAKANSGETRANVSIRP